MKKKLVIKKTKKTSSISAKIAEKQKENKVGKDIQGLSLIEGTMQDRSVKKQVHTKEGEASYNKNGRPKLKSKVTSYRKPGTQGSNKQFGQKKSTLREEILKKEDHKKFFINQQVRKKNKILLIPRYSVHPYPKKLRYQNLCRWEHYPRN